MCTYLHLEFIRTYVGMYVRMSVCVYVYLVVCGLQYMSEPLLPSPFPLPPPACPLPLIRQVQWIIDDDAVAGPGEEKLPAMTAENRCAGTTRIQAAVVGLCVTSGNCWVAMVILGLPEYDPHLLRRRADKINIVHTCICT